jgi:hypothetical protein
MWENRRWVQTRKEFYRWMNIAFSAENIMINIIQGRAQIFRRDGRSVLNFFLYTIAMVQRPKYVVR